MWVIGAEILALGGYLAYEAYHHRQRLADIPVRIHVNGTRGKSSVTRLIAAGMRAGGFHTIAKTTGTKPRFIFPDGSETPVIRAGKANVIEQVRIVRRAYDHGARVLVLECMAVKPELQSLCEEKLVRSTVGVITNVRADHLDEMGPTVADVAESLANTVPFDGILVTAERTHLDTLARRARQRGTRVIASCHEAVTDAMMGGFLYFEHRENVALALAVTSLFDIDQERALQGMQQMQPDPGALRIYRLNIFGTPITFVNAFAANDPDSYRIIWERIESLRTVGAQVVALVTCRKDRVSRAEQLAYFIATGVEADRYFVCGEATHPVYHAALGLGVPSSRIRDYGGRDAAFLFEAVLDAAAKKPVIAVGVGNIVGLGQQLADYFRHRGEEIAYGSTA